MATIVSDEVVDGYRVTTYDTGMVVRIIDAPAPPAPSPPLSPLAFLRRFTAAERVTVRASTDPYVQDFYRLLDRAAEVRLDDPDTVEGVDYLVQAGLLTSARAAEILAP